MEKSRDAFRTISEVAEWLDIQAHVLRFWESKFTQVKPVKRAGGRRYYRPTDMLLLGGIKKLLHDDGLTIKGVQKILREQGVDHVASQSRALDDNTGELLELTASAPNVVTFHSRLAAADQSPDAVEPDVPEIAFEEESADAAATPEPDIDPPQAEPVLEAAIADETGPDTVPAVVSEPEAEEPVADIEPAAPRPPSPSLPSFLHKPPAPEPEPAPKPRPRVVEAADPPPETDLPYRAGALARLAGLERIDPDQVEALSAIAADLRTLCDRISGQRPT